jgi:hypothetical protein
MHIASSRLYVTVMSLPQTADVDFLKDVNPPVIFEGSGVLVLVLTLVLVMIQLALKHVAVLVGSSICIPAPGLSGSSASVSWYSELHPAEPATSANIYKWHMLVDTRHIDCLHCSGSV